ncbi:unnamed protein product, partial [Allacma fusca]
MKGIIRVGDRTTGGGQVQSGSETMIFQAIGVARINDPVSCPIPGHSPSYIAQGHPTMKDNGVAVAFDGYKCSCGCTLISSLTNATTNQATNGALFWHCLISAPLLLWLVVFCLRWLVWLVSEWLADGWDSEREADMAAEIYRGQRFFSLEAASIRLPHVVGTEALAEQFLLPKAVELPVVVDESTRAISHQASFNHTGQLVQDRIMMLFISLLEGARLNTELTKRSATDKLPGIIQIDTDSTLSDEELLAVKNKVEKLYPVLSPLNFEPRLSLEDIDNLLDTRPAMDGLLIISVRLLQTPQEGDAEAGVALLLGSKKGNQPAERCACLHRPELTKDIATLNQSVEQSLQWGETCREDITHLWLAGFGIENKAQNFLANNNLRFPHINAEGTFTDIDMKSGFTGKVSPWLAIALAAGNTAEKSSPQLVMSMPDTANRPWWEDNVKHITRGIKNSNFQLWLILFVLLCIGVALCFIIKNDPAQLGISQDSLWQERLFITALMCTGGLLLFIILFFITTRLFGAQSYRKIKNYPNGDNASVADIDLKLESPHLVSIRQLKKHLRSRYRLLWRYKVRLLLVVGDDAARAALLPGLQEQHWLEGSRTVLIDGGSLNEEPDADKFAALRKLRRGRPLDGIIRVLESGQELTPQQSNNDLRALETIGTLLRWQPPVWLWQLCSSDWSQAGRAEQAIGATFPPRAQPQDIGTQLNGLLPPLRELGIAQIAQNPSCDFALRLVNRLELGGNERWQTLLTPWLHAAQQHIFLRGLMFSLPESSVAIAASGNALHRHALTLPASWQGIVNDCTRLRGRRVGMPWQQTLAWSLMSLMLLAGAGMLASALFNRQQIVGAADKAQVLVNSTKADDAQLIALHGLRNDLGQQQHWLAHGAPWYQRFGINHTHQLHDALLPWYGVAARRLIHEPARIALEDKLNYLASLPAASPLRATLAQPGYKQLKAWLMMARPERAEPAFYAQTMATVQPEYPGISTSLWQTLAPDLWAFYAASLPSQPEWRIKPNASLLSQVRQVLLLQTGQRNAEMTLYQNVLRDVRRNYTDLTLEDMTPGTDMRRLFSSDDSVPGVFTRQAWEGGVRQEIEKAANTRR